MVENYQSKNYKSSLLVTSALFLKVGWGNDDKVCGSFSSWYQTTCINSNSWSNLFPGLPQNIHFVWVFKNKSLARGLFVLFKTRASIIIKPRLHWANTNGTSLSYVFLANLTRLKSLLQSDSEFESDIDNKSWTVWILKKQCSVHSD